MIVVPLGLTFDLISKNTQDRLVIAELKRVGPIPTSST